MNLNLGSGSWELDGWNNVDLPDIDLRYFPWGWKNEDIDSILASHVLEHFTRQDGKKFLKECFRILKTGGKIYIAVPDLDLFVDCRLTGDYSKLDGYEWIDLNFLMGGDQRELNETMKHRAVYSQEILYCRLYEAGFRYIKRTGFKYPHNPRFRPISLYMEGRK